MKNQSDDDEDRPYSFIGRGTIPPRNKLFSILYGEKPTSKMMLPIEKLNLFTLNVGVSVQHADWNWKNVSSPFARLYYVTRGTATIHLPSGEVQLCPQRLYLIPPFTLHSYSCSDLFEHYYLHIYEDFATGDSILENCLFPVEVEPEPYDLQLFQRLCELNPSMALQSIDPKAYDNTPTLLSSIAKNKERSFCNRVESRGILYQLFSRFLEYATFKPMPADSRIQMALRYIRHHIAQPIGMVELARHIGMSHDNFSRLFKKEMQVTPQHYIAQKKMEKAQLLLVTSDAPVKSIAFQLGYADPSYFIRQFRKQVGVSPQRYREGR